MGFKGQVYMDIELHTQIKSKIKKTEQVLSGKKSTYINRLDFEF